MPCRQAGNKKPPQVRESFGAYSSTHLASPSLVLGYSRIVAKPESLLVSAMSRKTVSDTLCKGPIADSKTPSLRPFSLAAANRASRSTLFLLGLMNRQ